jgi:hypothetical protein
MKPFPSRGPYGLRPRLEAPAEQSDGAAAANEEVARACGPLLHLYLVGDLPRLPGPPRLPRRGGPVSATARSYPAPVAVAGRDDQVRAIPYDPGHG